MNVLGINGPYHELAAAVVVDGSIVAAAEEERFNRRKHGAEARVDNADALPAAAIEFCLDFAGLEPSALDAICYSFDPELRRSEYEDDPYARKGDWGHPAGEAAFRGGLARVPKNLAELLGEDVATRFVPVAHHLAHAASAFYPSGFERAAILVIDGIGEHATTTLGYGADGRVEASERILFPHSLGFTWEKLSRFLGFGEYDACKIMGLAATGDPDVYREQFASLVKVENGGFVVDADVMQFRRADFDGLVRVFGELGPALTQRHRDLAAALQAATDDVVLALARSIHAATGADALCLAGGVGLNCQTNWVVKETGPFERIFIPCAPHDAGTAIGAALYHSARSGIVSRNGSTASAYLGPSFDDAQIEHDLARSGLSVRPTDRPAREAAELIAEGKVVGWFQGRMEFGPRALGNRSLLADPRDPEMRELLNDKVKHREPFRPFAPSVLEESASEWLDLGRASSSLSFMSFACPVRPDRVATIPAVIHDDRTARAQIVSRAANPGFHELISEFEQLTGVGLVLNTSFNDSEPIVCSPADALATFRATGIDAIVMGSFVVER